MPFNVSTASRLLRSLCCAFVFAGLVPATVQADETLTIKHAKGETGVVLKPKNVAVIDWSTLDTLTALGIEAQGIPNALVVPPMLAQYGDKNTVRVGSLFEPDLEALKTMQPDLIILGRRASATYEEVAKFGPTIDLTPDPNDLLGSVVRNTQILGQIFDRKEEAQQHIDHLLASVEELKKRTANRGTGMTLLTTGGKMAAFGIGTRFGMLHDVFGIEPAVKDLKTGRHGQSVSFEFLLETNPDWLFVMDRDAAIGREGIAAAKMMDNELVLATSAGEKGQIVYLDPVSWYLLDNSGLRVMQDSVDRLLEVFAK